VPGASKGSRLCSKRLSFLLCAGSGECSPLYRERVKSPLCGARIRIRIDIYLLSVFCTKKQHKLCIAFSRHYLNNI